MRGDGRRWREQRATEVLDEIARARSRVVAYRREAEARGWEEASWLAEAEELLVESGARVYRAREDVRPDPDDEFFPV